MSSGTTGRRKRTEGSIFFRMETIVSARAMNKFGWEEMDRQHESLVDALRSLAASPRRRSDDLQELRRVFSSLTEHFRWEESEMELRAYPDRARHVLDHQRELWSLAELLRSLELTGELDAPSLAACDAWTHRHVASLDADFVEFVTEREIWDLRRECMETDYEQRLSAFAV